VIASQALISGAFSVTSQAIQLGILPRLQIFYTSSRTMGQIYIPAVNYMLFVMTLILVLTFQSSSNLASAYGIGVALVMINTTFLVALCQIFVWKWPLRKAFAVSTVFIVIDLAFVYSNMLKVLHGGWVPLAIGGMLFIVMSTWLRGREILAERLAENSLSLKDFFADLESENIQRVPGTAIFMARDIRQTPAALLQNTRHNQVVHENVILLQVMTEESPYVSDLERVRSEHIWDGFHRVYVRYGYMEKPHIPRALMLAKVDGQPIDPMKATYFLGREIVLATHRQGMALWRERLFAVLTQVALRATAFFRIPPERVIEIGMQVEL
ncbi:MAG: KUP/HAK/KT family potassium transporter, partial [Deltaproteobacteria bacterium]|nr:KUP/HAK/KT family potassium transporter [Deltaproteobacteria bacterium]